MNVVVETKTLMDLNCDEMEGLEYIYFPELGGMINTCVIKKVNNEFSRVCVHCGKNLSGVPAYPIGNGWQCVDNCFDEDYFEWLEVISL